MIDLFKRCTLPALALLLMSQTSVSMAEQDPLAAFPEAEANQQRYVIQLPEQTREQARSLREQYQQGRLFE